MPMSSSRLSLIQLHLSVLLAGGAGLFAKWVTASPAVITCGRTLFGSLALALVALLIQANLRVLCRKDLLMLALSGAVLAVHWFSFFLAIALQASAVETLSFNRDIRPILSENCFACHGFDSKKREAELRLDTPEGAYTAKEGAFPIKPGDLAKSEVGQRIITTDGDDLMPPTKSHKKISEAQKVILKRWVAEGAVYEKHWAFEPPQRATLPEVKTAGWVRNPIDAFLLSKLEAKGLSYSREADKLTLLRRATLDLTGLLPTAEEVAAFVADPSLEKVVDRLLASPAYGERWGRHWLDHARYADSNGYTIDGKREMWPYRDWVIDALNENKPYDQLVRALIWWFYDDLKAYRSEPTARRRGELRALFDRFLFGLEAARRHGSSHQVIVDFNVGSHVSCLSMCMNSQNHTHYMRKSPNFVSGIGAFSDALKPSASTRRVSAGSITPSSQMRAVA